MEKSSSKIFIVGGGKAGVCEKKKFHVLFEFFALRVFEKCLKIVQFRILLPGPTTPQPSSI